MATIAPKLPLLRDERFGVSAHTTIIGNAKQNLLNLLYTNPGERIDQQYGVGLKRFIFQNLTEETLENMKGIIRSQIAAYMPNITVYGIAVQESLQSENGVSMSITFSVAGSEPTTIVANNVVSS